MWYTPYFPEKSNGICATLNDAIFCLAYKYIDYDSDSMEAANVDYLASLKIKSFKCLNVDLIF